MEPGAAIYAAVKAAGAGRKGLKALDKYAADHGLSRGEALDALRGEALRRGDAAMRDYAGRCAQSWADEEDYAKQHPVKSVALNALPGGVLGRVAVKAFLAKRPGQ